MQSILLNTDKDFISEAPISFIVFSTLIIFYSIFLSEESIK